MTNAATATETTAPVTNEELVAFVEKVQAMVLAAHAAKGYTFPADVLSIDDGAKKYARIVKSSPGSRSVYCFVDLATGDILKAASWKAPAKHARGNIRGTNALAGLTEHGAAYMR
jgi:hypothetical protein